MNKITVTHLAYSVNYQTAAYRLHKSLLDAKVNSNMLVGSKSIIDSDIVQPKTMIEKLSALSGLLREVIYKKIINHNNSPYFSINNTACIIQKKWLNKIVNISPDIVHLHWIGNGFIPLNYLDKFDAPIVWTMHDVWAFTGGCHVNYDCSNYMVDCKECPQLELTRSKKIAHKNLLKKIEIIQKLNITIITPSSWMTAKVRESIVFKNKQVYTIPNALDLSIYKPLGRGYAKNVINTCKSKSLIAFGAISALSDKNKGYETLVEAINILVKHKKDVEVLIFGASMDLDIKVNFDCKVTLINRLSDDISLATIYSAADVVVVPSRQESYSQVTAESIACGTPVVAFNATGPKDIIDHKVNGYLAKPFEAKDLAAGVFWCIENSDRKLLLSKNAREKAVRFCSYEIVAKKHIDVYKKILHE